MNGLLSDRLYWIISYIKWFLIGFLHKITGRYFKSARSYAGQILYNIEEGMDIVSELIISGKPFAMVRESFYEFSILCHHQTYRLFGLDINSIKKTSIATCRSLELSGEGGKELLRKWIDIYERSIGKADVIGVYDNLFMGDAYLRECFALDKKKIVDAHVVGPYNTSNGWSKKLKGKKVVVVSPFSEEIRYQYSRRELLWDDPDILPEFELITVDSIWYYSSYRDERFETWFDALDYTYEEIIKNPFDIALLSCGKFATPLCMRIKEAGKQAIQMGSSLNKLFGLRMKRLDEAGDKCYNEYWIRPKNKLGEEAIKVLDNGGYW